MGPPVISSLCLCSMNEEAGTTVALHVKMLVNSVGSGFGLIRNEEDPEFSVRIQSPAPVTDTEK